ncbi:SusC/RagA family TonB-linked outer membrane protein [Sphingobacterium cellulitidis]|uniref:SusC/RagA family TonB-linked outer membrane protein n=1 Tax=Sphingobacterium cellulitidis TaxID=1768011 RepID=UPI003C7CF328
MKFNLFPFSIRENLYECAYVKVGFDKNRFIDNKVKEPNHFGPITSLLMKIHLIALIIVMAMTQVNARSIAQQITLKRENAKLSSILKDLEKQSGYSFFYKKTDVDPVKEIDVNFNSIPLNVALNKLLSPRNLTFEFFEKTIVIKKESTTSLASSSEQILSKPNFSEQQQVHGVVLDEKGNPISGATIRIKSMPNRAVVTDKNGRFILPITAINEIVVVSYIGYANHELKAVLTAEGLTIRMKLVSNEVDEVVITGMMEFKKDAFSGASSTFKREELKQVANTNVIQALKSLDPSFLVMENNLSGANPNILPNIELRGQTSITSENLRDEFTDDPNQPLFILDGFQSNLRTILDLDMNRIESITILKDASSTAIYGSRASNGVVVVETIRPKPGELRLNYTTDMNVEIADLGSYNMMNAAEKLEFERLTGIYTAQPYLQEYQHTYYDPLYNRKLENVLRGVDTYWLKTPIQTGFAHRHSLYVEGGNENFVYNIGGNYKKNNAVMKGSGRQEWGARSNLIYRQGKLSAINNLAINGNTADESNYGSFATWVNMNPYYANLDSQNPIIEEYIDQQYGMKYKVYNPIYNTQLNSFDNSKGFAVTNNFQLIYDLTSDWRITGSFQISKNIIKANTFISPLNTMFENTPLLQMGSYTSREQNQLAYTGNAMLSYGKSINKHTINGNARIEFAENNNSSLGFVAVGFPRSSNGNPAFAYGYQRNSSPSANHVISRRNSILATLNYSYDNRYNTDISFNYDGSTAFGRQNSYSPFFATGLSWNLHNESFLKDNPMFNQLRLRANYGVTGNQNFSSTTSISTYNYLSAYNYYGQGVTLATFANENLRWQKTNQFSAGIDATLLNNRFNLTFNIYNKITNDLAVAVNLPASTGLIAYPFNAGDLTVKGVELMTKYNIIHKPADRIFWNVGLTGARSTQTFNHFNNLLTGLNQSLQNSKSLLRYKDGHSPNDLWAVQSLGIDPATGREMFLKKDGTKTFDYDEQDIIALGNGNPLIQGVLSTNITYKGFMFGAYMRYIYDQDVLNYALFNKVENISLTDVVNYNQDKRALYDRWVNVGDVSKFRGISITDNTSPSSRFIQQENSFSLESISLSYDFRDSKWIQKAGLSNLRISGITNEVFRWSTVRRERGIDYPYAKMYSLTINANF